MFELYDKEIDNKFSWDQLGTLDGRENLGEEMPVFIYRLFQFTIKDVISQRYDKEECVHIFREAGYLSGIEFANHLLKLDLPFDEFIADLQDILSRNKVGVLRVEKFDKDSGDAVLTISEDLDCSGLPVTGETVCNYDEGFLRGILNTYTKKNYEVKEVDCWATGSRVCRFVANVTECNS